LQRVLPADNPRPVLQFFKGFELKEGSLKLDPPRPGARDAATNAGSALIKFVSGREAQKAVNALHRAYMGPRWVSLQVL